MSREIRIYRSTPFDPMAQSLLVPPKSRSKPDLTDLTGPNSYFYLASRDETGLGCIALRNMGTFGMVSAFRFLSEHGVTSLPHILIDQVETQARSLRLPVVRVWVDRMHPVQSKALRQNGYFPAGPEDEHEDMRLYERALRRGPTGGRRPQGSGAGARDPR
jgi:hypothetical protein